MAKIEFLLPWDEIAPEIQRYFEQELQREVGRNHPLDQVSAKAIARRIDRDDVLFALADGRCVVVHLAFAGRETRSDYPSARFFESIESWVENCMRPDSCDS
jgi:hypothetical protein